MLQSWTSAFLPPIRRMRRPRSIVSLCGRHLAESEPRVPPYVTYGWWSRQLHPNIHLFTELNGLSDELPSHSIQRNDRLTF